MKTKLTKLFVEFFESEKASGIILIICTVTSIAIANSYFGKSYLDFWHTIVGFEIAETIALKYSLGHWINDGLMAIFFLLIGLADYCRHWRHGNASATALSTQPGD
jgi:NhaA family Na+:H+ antiporter